MGVVNLAHNRFSMVEFEIPYDRATPLFALQYAIRAQTVAERCLCIANHRETIDVRTQLADIFDWMKRKLAAPAAVTGELLPQFEQRRDQAIRLVYGDESGVGHLEGPVSEGGQEVPVWSGGTIKVATLTGHQYQLEKMASWTTGIVIREWLQELAGPPPNQQVLIANGRLMLDHMTLGEMGIAHGGTIHMTLKMHSGKYHVPASAKMSGAFGPLDRLAKFEFEFDTAGWEGHAKHPIWGHDCGGIQIDLNVTLGQLTETLTHYAITNKIPLPKGFRVGMWGWPAIDGFPPPEMPVGSCNFFTIVA